MNHKITKHIAIVVFLAIGITSFAQSKYQTATVAFYNVENLFDTIRSCDKINGFLKIDDKEYNISIPEDSCIKNPEMIHKGAFTFDNLKDKISYRKQILTDDFTVSGSKLWTKKRFDEKVNHLSEVFLNIATDISGQPPVVIGLAEVENKSVVEEIINNPKMKKYDYGISHFNSFDARGIDVALIYQKKRFKVISEKRFPVIIYNEEGYRDYTRDILMVSGDLDGDRIHFFVNHWPSRRGGEARSEPRRIEAAKVLKTAMDSLRSENPNAKIIAMGDLNDDPTNKSVKEIMNTSDKKEKTKVDNYYNPMEKMFKKGMGTLAYRDALNLFDQMFISYGLLANKNNEYFYYKSGIFSPSYLISQEGQFKGYPFRSFAGSNYTGGYSDHYPVYTILVKKVD